MEPTTYLIRYAGIHTHSMIDSLYLTKVRIQNQNFCTLLCIFRENRVWTWNIGCFSLSYPNKEVGCTKIFWLQALSLNAIRKYLFIATSLSGFLVECRPHNWKVPGSNPVRIKKTFFHNFWSIFDRYPEIFFASNSYSLYILWY